MTDEDSRARERVEDKLRETTERMAAIIDASMDAIITMDERERIVVFSAAAERLFRVRAEEVVGQSIDQFIPAKFRGGHGEHVAKFKASGSTVRAMGQFTRLSAVRADGSEFPIEASIAHLSTASGHLFLVTIRDVTERERSEAARLALEAQLRHAQKLEAVGQLAGGIAHDFNNLLTVISATTQLAKSAAEGNPRLLDDLHEIELAASRATALTRGLLAFSHRQLTAPTLVDLSAVVSSIQPMLRRLIRADIALRVDAPHALASVRADPGLVEQVLMNLVINARDAQPDGGSIDIAVRGVEVTAPFSTATGELPPGPYIRLSVRDAGTGMSREILDRIFEPFFTTKAIGQGTGLGLATVYGIVTQSGGAISVESTVGVGTTFSIHLPVAADQRVAPPPAPAPPAAPGTETILVVEDNEQLLQLARRILRKAGYSVMVAGSGDAALRQLREYDGPLHLMLTDVVMPGLGGGALAQRVAADRPGVRILFTSGYSSDDVLRQDVLDATVDFIGKPYGVTELTNKVREVLDR